MKVLRIYPLQVLQDGFCLLWVFRSGKLFIPVAEKSSNNSWRLQKSVLYLPPLRFTGCVSRQAIKRESGATPGQSRCCELHST